MPLGKLLHDLFDGDDDGAMTEGEYEALHRDDPPEAPEPLAERSHPETTPDEEGD